MTKNIPYCCIRCGYKTEHKTNMKHHFYKKLRPCPGSINDIVLTDEIKQSILDNRVYHLPKEKPENNVINTFNIKSTFFIDDIFDAPEEILNHIGSQSARLLSKSFGSMPFTEDMMMFRKPSSMENILYTS